MNPLHEQFVVEARDLLHEAVEDLIALERDGQDAKRIDRVFRSFHTLKGSAGVVSLPAMTLVLHAGEDLLAAIRSGQLAISPVFIERALECLDHVERWVNAFEAQGVLPSDSGEIARSRAERMRSLLTAPPAATVSTDGEAPSPSAALKEVWVTDLVALSASRPGGELFAIDYAPRAGCFFDGDDPVELMRQIPQLLALKIEPREAWPPKSELDPYNCNLRLLALSGASHEKLAHVFRLVPDQVRLVHVPPQGRASQPQSAATSGNISPLLEAVIQEQLAMLQVVVPAEERIGRIGAACRVAENILRHTELESMAEGIVSAGAEAAKQKAPAILISTLVALSEALRSADDDVGLPVTQQLDPVERPQTRTLRVDETRIDTLVNLAAELIVAKNGLQHAVRRADGSVDPEFLRDIRQQHDSIERLVAELHTTTLQLRMLPVAQLFRAFPRLVRDTSLKLGKKAMLTTKGEAVECDKNLIDRLFEPLMHLVRNSLDHGIETPASRLAAGKPETGTISLSVRRNGDRLILVVSDDGGGIDLALVRRKAQERNLVTAAEAESLTDEQAAQLVFAAGFSTTNEVSELSGRGVGMDVVRATVEQIGGRVSIRSNAGAGTAVTLDMPLTIAMSRVMVVGVGQETFGILMDAVAETVRVTADQIRMFKENEAFVLRDRVVPICRLADLIKMPGASTEKQNSRLFVIVDSGGGLTALEIEYLGDRFEVVLKPMQGLLANTKLYSGTTLTGDGKVLLVLNLKELVP